MLLLPGFVFTLRVTDCGAAQLRVQVATFAAAVQVLYIQPVCVLPLLLEMNHLFTNDCDSSLRTAPLIPLDSSLNLFLLVQ